MTAENVRLLPRCARPVRISQKSTGTAKNRKIANPLEAPMMSLPSCMGETSSADSRMASAPRFDVDLLEERIDQAEAFDRHSGDAYAERALPVQHAIGEGTGQAVMAAVIEARAGRED